MVLGDDDSGDNSGSKKQSAKIKLASCITASQPPATQHLPAAPGVSLTCPTHRDTRAGLRRA